LSMAFQQLRRDLGKETENREGDQKLAPGIEIM